MPAQFTTGDNIGADLILERAFGSWQFDACALAKATANRPLSVLGMYFFNRLGFVQEFGLSRDRLSSFLLEIERGYDDSNPYHNRAHAASVLHAMHALLEHGGLMKAAAPLLDDEQTSGSSCNRQTRGARLHRMACLLAAAVHDYEHKGLSNDFLVKTGHTRATLYNNEHVNEHHHVAAAFDVLLRPENNFLEHLPDQELCMLRSLVTDLVLSTDMAQHGKIMQSARQVLGASSRASTADAVRAAFEPASRGEAVVLLQLAVKCSDLGHMALDWELHLQWVQRLEEEFFLQGDREKEGGLPVSFLMDRCQPGPSGSQVGFFDAVVLPLFELLLHAAPQAEIVLKSVRENYQRWRDLEGLLSLEP